MDPQDLQPKRIPALASDDENPSESSATRIFDISEDSISPISTEDLVKPPIPQQKLIQTNGHPIIPPETELLDKKIGSFDATPFAPPVTSKVAASFVNSYTQKTPPQKTITPLQPAPEVQIPRAPQAPTQQEHGAPTYLEPVQPSDFVKLNDAPQTSGTQTATQPIPTLDDQTKQNMPTEAPIVPPHPPLAENYMREIKPMRTYEGDVAEAMSHKRTSTASIAIAESKKQEGEERIGNEEVATPSHAGKKITMFTIGLVLIGGGAFGAYYLYSKSALAPVARVISQPKAPPSLVPTTNQAVLTVDIQNPKLVLNQITNEINKTQAPDTVKELVIAEKDSSGNLFRVPAQDMIKAFDINVPDILSRSLTNNWMLGVYADQNNNKSVFAVFTTNFFQNTFAGMLQWENVMADDLKQYIYSSSIDGISNELESGNVLITPNVLDSVDSSLPRTGTTTSTSTTLVKNATNTPALTSSSTEIVEPLKKYFTIHGKFEDRIVKNKDVRAFRADNGDILFLYSFIDNTHLVITDKESTLAEILTRLEKQAFIR